MALPLTEYRRKRVFKNTTEPKGKTHKPSRKLVFVVQKHAASHLHYDFRLEMEGVLKSWAVPKGPSLDPEEKRLALMVEDHPFEYKDFEGNIPEGNYGAGEVIIWDTGTYRAADAKNGPGEKELLAGLQKGRISFVLEGKKLKGEFSLVKMHGRDPKAWLLIKKDDAFASRADVLEEDRSVISGKTLVELSPKEDPETEDPEKPAKAKTGKKDLPPARVKPMLAEIAEEPFDDPDWIFEQKFDGYRALAIVHNGEVDLFSRNYNSFNSDYPEIVAALRKLKHTAILDGEVVAEDEHGRDRFQLLQNRGNMPARLRYHVFDLVHLNGYDLGAVPLINRKSLLKKLVTQLRSRTILYSDYVKGEGIAFYKKAMRENREGIIAKYGKSPYRYGARSREWLKIKIHQQQETVIAGFTEPRGSREHIGALLLAVHEGGGWKYVGRCGTGFTRERLGELIEMFKPYFTKESPFREKITSDPVQWLRPHFVCEVKFSEWTQDDILRQPVFLGLRKDKKATEVIRERPVAHAGKTNDQDPKNLRRKSA